MRIRRTHDAEEAKSYASDPLISRAVSVDVLVDMYDTSTRLLADAAAIQTPTLLLSSGKDYVVRLDAQREFFRRLGSPMKEMREYGGAYHDLWHESGRAWPIAHAREFLLRAFDRPAQAPAAPANEERYARLSRRLTPYRRTAVSAIAFYWYFVGIVGLFVTATITSPRW